MLNPFNQFQGRPPGETQRNQTFSKPTTPPPTANTTTGSLSSVESLNTIAQKAWTALSEAVKSKDVEKLKEARKYYNDLVYSTSRKNGKYLYFLGRANEELYYATKNADYQRQALSNFDESVKRLSAAPDASKCVSLRDAIKKTYFEQGRFGASGLGGGTITSSDGPANVRGGAAGNILGALPAGSKVDILGKNGAWFRAVYNNREKNRRSVMRILRAFKTVPRTQ